MPGTTLTSTEMSLRLEWTIALALLLFCQDGLVQGMTLDELNKKSRIFNGVQCWGWTRSFFKLSAAAPTVRFI